MPNSCDPAARPLPPGPTRFGFDVLPPTSVTRVRGDIDYLVAPVLRRHLLEHIASARSVLVVDLSGVTLLSAAAIQALATVCSVAPEQGVEVRLVAASRVVLRPLQLTGMDEHLPLYPTIDAATRPG